MSEGETPPGPPSGSYRKPGRPKRSESANVPWIEVDRALVFGELRTDPITGENSRIYPSYAELGERYRVTKAWIGEFARKHNCMLRRADARTREEARLEAMALRQGAKTIENAVKVDAARSADAKPIVDKLIVRFGRDVDEGRVRCDTPADFDRIVRLKELITGNADSRQEVNGSITLAAIQESRRKVAMRLDDMTKNPALSGVEKVASDAIEVVATEHERVTPDEREPANTDERVEHEPAPDENPARGEGGDDGAGH